nr:MAG TPA: hypothetical protein [Caudoviricetes sp.]
MNKHRDIKNLDNYSCGGIISRHIFYRLRLHYFLYN